MTNKKYIEIKDKDYYLKESKVFCMFPWVHLNVTPKGDIYPCCSNDYSTPYGNTKNMSLKEAFNSNKMKELRLNMLNDIPSKICNFCYTHEQSSPHSFRTYSMDQFSSHFDELIPTTNIDGSVDDFKMRYFDIRFSNICNFKCRTCGAEFSSQWAKENRIYNKTGPILMHADNQTGKLLEEVLEHIDHIDLAYFAGGEPLITDEHYVMLEEMIRKNKTDIVLRYNTNASNIKYKNHDVLNLWKHFKKIELSCSIDHYGEKAEWIRNGTDWAKVETNLKLFRSLDYVDFQINTVFSIFNVLTITEFYNYMMTQNLVKDFDWHHSLYLALNPPHYSAQSLPIKLKPIAEEKINNFILNRASNFPLIYKLLANSRNFIGENDSWEANKDIFWKKTSALDKLRGESFIKTFPELHSLLTENE